MTHHQLCEWEGRRFGADGLTEEHARALDAAADAPAQRLANKPRVFDFGRDSLTARHVCGVIAAGEVTCEILPKVDKYAPSGEPAALRHQLIRMLGVAHDLPIADDAATALGTQNETLLDILIARFAGLLAEAARRGLPRAYIAHEEDLPALRGRLDVTRQFSTLAAAPHRLACRYDEFSADIPLNPVMRAAIARLRALTRSPANARLLAELALLYAEVTPVPPAMLPWHALARDRATARWDHLIRLARLILGERFQNSAAGPADGFALLFDMNVLFENYVAKLLAPIAAARGLKLRSQGGNRKCLFPEAGGDGLHDTKPDLLIDDGAGTRLVIDTKWKCLADRVSDARMGVDQADIYQLMAYAQLYICDHVMLLYPRHAGLASPLPFHSRIAAAEGPARLSIAAVDLTSHDAARGDLARLLAVGQAN